jgi:hypothetical protein
VVAWAYVLFHGRSDGRRLSCWRAIGVGAGGDGGVEFRIETRDRASKAGGWQWPSGPCISGGDQRKRHVNSSSHSQPTAHWLGNATRLLGQLEPFTPLQYWYII